MTEDLREIEQLEIKKKDLQREVEHLNTVVKQLRIEITDRDKSIGGLKEQSYELESEVSNLLDKNRISRKELEDMYITYAQKREAVSKVLGTEMNDFLRQLREAEKALESKKVEKKEYEDGLREKEQELIRKESELKEVEEYINKQLADLSAKSARNEEMLDGLKKWEEELLIESNDLIERAQNLSTAERDITNRESTFSKESAVFLDKVGEWARKIENKRKLIVGVSTLLEDRQEGINNIFEEINREKLILEDQRLSLKIAWDELRSLQGK